MNLSLLVFFCNILLLIDGRPHSTRSDVILSTLGLKDKMGRSIKCSNNFGMEHNRRKRFITEGSYWGTKNITYRISQYPAKISRNMVDLVIENAFKVWQQHSYMNFKKVSGHQSVNIDIRFANLEHNDGEPFDGKGGILAHAFFPRYGGGVHFDADETWYLNPRSSDSRRFTRKIAHLFRSDVSNLQGIDLYSVAAHEIGHALGLKHSENDRALMAPFYQEYSESAIRLHDDDIRGLKYLYDGSIHGHPSLRGFRNLSRVDSTVFFSDSIVPEVNEVKVDSNSITVNGVRAILSEEADEPKRVQTIDICEDPSLDALCVLGNGTAYAFKGAFYWKLNLKSYDNGYPRKISRDWPGLPNDLDAAVTDNEGDTYFFKDDNYWLFDTNGKPYKGYPKKMVSNVDHAGKIDAAMTWNYDGQPYFFHENKYWKYSPFHLNNRKFWPRPLSYISDKLTKVDAAFKWTNGKTYVFSGPYYYQLTGWKVMKVAKGYPRLTGEWWFGCTYAENLDKIHGSKDYSNK